MRIIISGGGTAGHINPALTVCGKLMERSHEVLFIGTPDGMERHLAEQAGIPFLGLEAKGYDRAKPMTLITSSALVLKSSNVAARNFRRERPDCVVGFGGYVSLPVGLAACRLGIPLVIHEQNSVPGLANRELAKKGAHVALTYDLSRKYFECPDDRMTVVGNPVRESVLAGDRARGRAKLGVPDDALLALIMGGSLGARHLNEAICRLADDLMSIPDLYIVHSTGKRDFEMVKDMLGERGKRWAVRDYIDDMGDMLMAADAAVSRAGSTSLAEIAVAGLPALLVPFPHATDDHQTKNARDLEQAGAAYLVPDSELDDAAFASRLTSFLTDRQALKGMSRAACGLARPDAADRLADLICTLAANGRTGE